jgi:hypothetical protein
MEPMKPMEPMEPMAPLPRGEAWWPDDLGNPAITGSQNGVRYAYFPDRQRLLIEREGIQTIYDSADHQINGVSQRNHPGKLPAFTSDHGEVRLARLRQIV